MIDNFGKLLGVVQLDHLREDMFKREKYNNSIRHYTTQPPDNHRGGVDTERPAKFENKHTWMLPVVTKDNKYSLYSQIADPKRYRKQLIKISQ